MSGGNRNSTKKPSKKELEISWKVDKIFTIVLISFLIILSLMLVSANKENITSFFQNLFITEYTLDDDEISEGIEVMFDPVTQADFPVAVEEIEGEDTFNPLMDAESNDIYNMIGVEPITSNCILFAPVLNDEIMRKASDHGCDSYEISYLKRKSYYLCTDLTGTCIQVVD